MSEIWQSLVSFVQSDHFFELVAASGVVSAVVAAISKFCSKKLKALSGRSKFMLVTGMSAIVTALTYYIDSGVINPAATVAIVGFGSQNVYYIVRSLRAGVERLLKWVLASYVERAIALNEELKSAVVPDTGLTVAPVVEGDFTH